MNNRRPVFPCRSLPDLKKLMESCGSCPNCNADNENIVAMTDMERPSIYTIECSQCEVMGPWSSTLEGAVKNWRNSGS